MIQINPKEYEYLWTDSDVNFIFVSCYLFKNFKETDFVLMYDPDKNGVAFFIGKEAKKACAEYGVTFYNREFEDWEERIELKVKEGKRIIEQTKEEKGAISSMNDEILRKKFLERVMLFQDLGNLYFYTEFFFLGKVEEEIKQKKNKVLEEKLERMGKIKLEGREVLNEFYNYARMFQPYAEEIGKRKKRNDVPWLSYEEIIALIDGKEVTHSKREKETWILTKKNQWNIITGEKAEEIKKSFTLYFFSKNIDTVKGMVANKGKYKGKVKVLKTIFSDKIIEELKKVQKGDVLIANTTGPEVMRACERAGAIVTDEGGITSHAAIVSRELDIPCIVGTINATHILQDGDEVEVDATEGIVRIIKKRVRFTKNEKK